MQNHGVNFYLNVTNNGAPAFNSFNRGMRSIGKATQSTRVLSRSMNAGLNANRRAVQQFGFQMTDFAIQIAGGQNAMLAFTQQGGQMLQFFGPVGAIMAALLSVFGSMFIAMTKTGTSMNTLFPIMGVLEDQMRGLVEWARGLSDTFIDLANLIINNLDRVIITLGVGLGILAVRMIAARVATMTLAGALNFLRGAIIRTGIGALVVGAGYLIERFLTLQKGAGGFGNAVALMGDLIRAVFADIGAVFNSMVSVFRTGALRFQMMFLKAIHTVGAAFVDLTWEIADGMNAVFGTNLSGATLGGGLADIAAKYNEVSAAAESAAAARNAAFDGVSPGVKNAIGALKDAMVAGESTKVDVRDWFGGGSGGGDEGAGGIRPDRGEARHQGRASGWRADHDNLPGCAEDHRFVHAVRVQGSDSRHQVVRRGGIRHAVIRCRQTDRHPDDPGAEQHRRGSRRWSARWSRYRGRRCRSVVRGWRVHVAGSARGRRRW